MIRLSKEQVLNLHSQLIHATGGSCGVRNLTDIILGIAANDKSAGDLLMWIIEHQICD